MPCVTRAFWNQVFGFSVSVNDGRCSAQRKFRWGSLHNSERGCWSGAGVLCCGGCSWQRVITESLWWGFVWEDPDLNRLRLSPCWVLVQLYSCTHILLAFWRSGDRSESACFTEETRLLYFDHSLRDWQSRLNPLISVHTVYGVMKGHYQNNSLCSCTFMTSGLNLYDLES